MAKLTISNTHPQLDGEYELDLANAGFTKTEYHLMKKNVGVVVGDLMPGSPVDMNVMTAFALVMLRRAGKEHLFSAYMETTDEQAVWDFGNEVGEDDALPPVLPQAKPPENGQGDVVELSAGSKSSGPNTSASSDDSQATRLPLTGSQP